MHPMTSYADDIGTKAMYDMENMGTMTSHEAEGTCTAAIT